jgi:hypothetical protein
VQLTLKLPSTDLERDSENVVKRMLKDLSKAPAPKQLAVGASAGWLVGYLTMKVGKAAATAVGGSLLLLQVQPLFYGSESFT